MKDFDPGATQVGGTHYADMKIQPLEVIKGLQLGWCLGNAYKYVSRYKYKNGQQDLAKAYDYVRRELHDRYFRFEQHPPKLNSGTIALFRDQFSEPVSDILFQIELIHRTQWYAFNENAEYLWSETMKSLLLSINNLCKEEYGVNAY